MSRAGALAPFILTLDVPLYSSLIRHTVSKVDGQLGKDHAPILSPAGPFFGNVHHCQIQHLKQAVIRGEYRFCLSYLAKLAVEILYGISGIDEPTFFLRILKVGAEIRPTVTPGLGNFRVFLIPFLCKRIQCV